MPLSPTHIIYISMALDNIIRALLEKANDMTDEELDAAIVVEQARRKQLDARRETH